MARRKLNDQRRASLKPRRGKVRGHRSKDLGGRAPQYTVDENSSGPVDIDNREDSLRIAARQASREHGDGRASRG